MNETMYRQPRRAAIITDANEDIHTAFLLRRRRKIQFILTMFLAVLSLSVCVFLLFLLNEEKEAVDSPAAITSAEHLPDYLCPDAVSLQTSIADKVLRLHIRANSDLPCDQEIKLKVRDAVCSYLTLHMNAGSKDEAKDWINKHMSEIIDIAQTTLSRSGYNYTVSAKLTNANFPLRQYEDFFLPAGIYEALQIELGSGEGHNWWCILFPTLCLNNALVLNESTEPAAEAPLLPSATSGPIFRPNQNASLGQTFQPFPGIGTDSMNPEPATESSQKLADALEAKEYDAIRCDRQKITFRFRILDLLRDW